MPTTIELSRPLDTHNGPVSKIELRDPVASDFFQINRIPIGVHRTGDTEQNVVDFKIAGQWLSRLSGIDEILLGKMNGIDLIACLGKLNEHLATGGAGLSVGNSGP